MPQRPRGVPAVDPVPHGHTARRLQWDMLPPFLRDLVEERLGGAVVDARSAGSGFTPGFASTLTLADGTRHFVKAASVKAQRMFADSYREEIRKLRALPDDLPVPRLRWTHDDDLWVVLGLEHVSARPPARPWRTDELDACLDTLEVLADRLTPPPLSLASFASEFSDREAWFTHARRVSPDLPGLDEAVALADRCTEATTGNTLVHTDARDDNFLLADGRAWLCDWNWPVVGAPWIDTVLVLISAFGDHLDVDAVLASRRLTRAVDPEHVDALLALLLGYFLKTKDDPVPSSSPYIREHQAWYAEVTWAWLAARRGWSGA